MSELLKLYGIGEKTAQQIEQQFGLQNKSEAQIRSILLKPDNFNKLPVLIKADLMHKPHKRVPRDAIFQVELELERYLAGIKFNIAGSYRRGRQFSRDIDLLISQGNYKSAETLWSRITKLLNRSKKIKLLKPYQTGSARYTLVIKLNNWRIKTDVFITQPDEYIFALLYATGSGAFNMIMRAQAKRKGYLLNQKGLYNRQTGRPIQITTEKDIFRKLNMRYRTPAERDIK